MPQNIPTTYIAKIGGNQSALNVTAPGIIKTYQSDNTTVYRVVVNTVGTSGTLTLNDEAALGSESPSNTILSVPFGSLTQGQVFDLKWPCANGIVLSSIPTGGSVSISYS